MNQISASILFLLTTLYCCNGVCAQSPDGQLRRELDQLQSKVRDLETDNRELERNQRKLIDESGGIGVVLILFGTVCALWAQNTGRSAWLWFFLGMVFSVVTVFFLLSKNFEDLRQQQLADRRRETSS